MQECGQMDLQGHGCVGDWMISEKDTTMASIPMGPGTIPATGKKFHVPCVDIFHLESGKVSAFDCHYAGTIMLAQLGVLGNLEASLKK